jgi:hypothetical protein
MLVALPPRGDLRAFQPAAGMFGSRLNVPVCQVRSGLLVLAFSLTRGSLLPDGSFAFEFLLRHARAHGRPILQLFRHSL